MAEFKPSLPYTTGIELLVPSYCRSKGVQVKTFPDSGEILYCSFRTYGGTEDTTNGVYTVHDTAQVETWYRPDIRADCRVRLILTGDVYEVIGKPENVNMRNQFIRFKVQAVEGGA